MYIKLKKAEVKDLSEKVYRSVKESLDEKNMDYQDAEVVLSVELRDKEKPSKTLVQYTRRQKEAKVNMRDVISSLLGDLSKGIDEDLSDEKNKENALSKIEEAKLNSEQESKTLYFEMVDLFKDMIKDEDNKLVLIVKNEYINLEKEIPISSYKELPESIQDLVKDNKLNF